MPVNIARDRAAVARMPFCQDFAGRHAIARSLIASGKLSLALAVRTVRRDDAKFEALMGGWQERSGPLILSENFKIVHRDSIVTLAARYRLPAVYPYRFFTEIGGLMS